MRPVHVHTVALLFVTFAAAANTPPPVSFTRAEIPAGINCCSVLTADFNGDGIPDVAAVYQDNNLSYPTGSQLVILLGKGDGTFAPPKTISLGPLSANLLAAVDINGDRKPDLVLTGYVGTFTISGNGDGTFGPPQLVDSSFAVGVADFTGDGIPDLLFGDLSVRVGKGDGTFGLRRTTTTDGSIGAFFETALGYGSYFVVGDFNRDGSLDVAYTSSWHDADGRVWVWLGNGDGTFRFTTSIMANASLLGPTLVVADFNGDGKLDIAVCASNRLSPPVPTTTAAILLGNGDGTFQTAGTAQIAATTLAAADLNGDGFPDLISDTQIALSNGDGTFQPGTYIGYGAPALTSPHAIVAADFDRDGLLDLVLPSHLNVQYPIDAVSLNSSTGLSVLLSHRGAMPTSVSAVSAILGSSPIAPASLASIYGSHLPSVTAAATDLSNPPTTLGAIRVHVRDSLGVDRLAQLLFASPTQINWVVPPGTAAGLAAINIDDGQTPFVEGLIATPVANVVPALFTADGSGSGVAAATAVRISPSGEQTSVPVFSCAGGKCSAVPIDLTQGPVYLTLYGSGFRLASTSQPPRCYLPPPYVFADASYFGPSGGIAGLDQVNLLLPPSLASGATDVTCWFDSTAAPPVQIAIK